MIVLDTNFLIAGLVPGTRAFGLRYTEARMTEATVALLDAI